MSDDIRIGSSIELEIQAVGNGGICIARHDGKVVFVRHALPGERVIAEITDITSKFLRADTTTVLEAHKDRVEPPCIYATICGGCDWQHASLALQRELKSVVIREQMRHLGEIDSVNGARLDDFEVAALPGDEHGLRWRTRNRFVNVSSMGLGMRMSRSHSVVEIEDCLIADSGAAPLARQALHLNSPEIETALSSTGAHVVVDERGGPWLDEQVGDRHWRIHASSFWQIHKSAAKTFVDVVRSFANLRSGQSLLDLYAGSALFAASLAADVGDKGIVVAVESNIDAVRDARRSCSDLGQLELVTSDVKKWLHQNREGFDVVVLDPPRTGAGLEVSEAISKTAKEKIIYVACEPSALARDTGYLQKLGWSLTKLRGFDAFPMTSHVECIALFER